MPSAHLPKVKEILARGGHITVRSVARELGVSVSTAATLLRDAGKQRAEPGAWSGGSPDAEVLALLRGLVAAEGRRLTLARAVKAVGTAGLSAGFQRVRVLLLQVKQEAAKAASADPMGPLESARWDGLVTSNQIIEAFGLPDHGAVKMAMARGMLTPVKREGKVWLFDPAKVRPRKDGRVGVVDAGHPNAAE